MKNIINLSRIYIAYFLNKKNFIYALILIVVVGLFIIPNKDSGYVTFSIGKFTGESNCFWVSSLGAISINIILSIVGFFLIENTYNTEKKLGFGHVVRVSSASNFKLLLHKWLTYVVVLSSFAVLLIVCLFVINYKYFDFFSFLNPFLYFCFPYIVMLSTIILVFDSLIPSRVLKVVAFLALIVVLCSSKNSGHFDLLGFNEFSSYIQKESLQNPDVQNQALSVGFIKKTIQLGYIKFNSISWVNHIYYKLLFIPFSILLLYLFSFLFKRYKPNRTLKILSPTKVEPESTEVKFNTNKLLFSINQECAINSDFWQVVNAYFILFKATFSVIQLIITAVFWVIAFLVNYELASHIYIPIVFLISFNKYEEFINIDNIENVRFTFNTSLFSIKQRLMAKSLILFSYFLLCAFPLLISNDANTMVMITINLLLLSVFSIIVSYVLKSVKILEIVYIIIFASYIAGHPAISLF